MLEISRFHGIVITMLFKDIKQHNKRGNVCMN
jgi:hypothetical protein